MSPRFTPTQAKLVLEDAGLDPDKPISEQLGNDDVGLEQRVAQLTTRVEQLTQQLATPAEPPKSQEEAFTERYAQALGRSRSQWFNADGSVEDHAS